MVLKVRLIPVGGFYEAADEPVPTEVVSDDSDKDGKWQPPAYDDITVLEMKKLLEEGGVDYSGHDQNKQTLYAFFVEEAKKRADNGGAGGAGTPADPGQ